jgi:hypothetical protein
MKAYMNDNLDLSLSYVSKSDARYAGADGGYFAYLAVEEARRILRDAEPTLFDGVVALTYHHATPSGQNVNISAREALALAIERILPTLETLELDAQGVKGLI